MTINNKLYCFKHLYPIVNKSSDRGLELQWKEKVFTVLKLNNGIP